MAKHKITIAGSEGEWGETVSVFCSCGKLLASRHNEIELREVVLLAFEHNEKVGR